MNFDWVSENNFWRARELQSMRRMKYVQIVDIRLFLEKLFLEHKCGVTKRLPRKAEKND